MILGESVIVCHKIPSFDNPVVSKITELHNNLSSLQATKCSICLERCFEIILFKNVRSTDPKLYCADNDMDPGPVPLNLRYVLFWLP